MAKATVTLIAKDKLASAIDAWGKKGSKWTVEGQQLGLSALDALAKHGDIGFANRLYVVMPKGTKSSAMAEWLLAFGSLRANEDKATKKDKPFLFDRERTTDLEGAAQKPWYEFGKEKAPDELFDIQAAFFAVFKKAAKAKQTAHGELLEAVRSVFDDLGIDTSDLGVTIAQAENEDEEPADKALEGVSA